MMTYELSPFPAALFEAREILRKADKPPLAHAVEEKVSKESDSAILSYIPSTEQIVIDGGSLLHRLPWKKGRSYGSIAGCYADFTALLRPLKTIHTTVVAKTCTQLSASQRKQSLSGRGKIFYQCPRTNKHLSDL